MPGLSGFGKSIFRFSVVDQVMVPAGLEPGEYLLSWRWDCEQSDQVFQNCADVKITADQSAGQQRIPMDQSKMVTVYEGSGNVKCDGLYEKCDKSGKGDSKMDDVGQACLKFGVDGC